MRIAALIAFVVALVACGKSEPNVKLFCERYGGLHEAAANGSGGLDPPFDYPKCETDARELAKSNPNKFACVEKCSGHFGLGEYRLCSRRCSKPMR